MLNYLMSIQKRIWFHVQCAFNPYVKEFPVMSHLLQLDKQISTCTNPSICCVFFFTWACLSTSSIPENPDDNKGLFVTLNKFYEQTDLENYWVEEILLIRKRNWNLQRNVLNKKIFSIPILICNYVKPSIVIRCYSYIPYYYTRKHIYLGQQYFVFNAVTTHMGQLEGLIGIEA